MDEGEMQRTKRGKVLCKAYEGWKGRIAEWMVLFMRTDFCSDLAATLIGRERKEGCWGRVDEADERAIVESTIGRERLDVSLFHFQIILCQEIIQMRFPSFLQFAERLTMSIEKSGQ